MQTKGSRVRIAVVIAMMFLAASSIPLVAQATTKNLTNRVLKETHFFVFNQQLSVLAGCNTVDCRGTAPVFKPKIQCPVALNSTCTYQIQVYGQVSLTPEDSGYYRFLINGAAPTVGTQTDSDGYFLWALGPLNPYEQAQSYAVVTTVKNGMSANQNHGVEVDISCIDFSGDGYCGVQFLSGELRVDVFVP